jgi:pimeloyl-ACP methyl ester carboxylesterase
MAKVDINGTSVEYVERGRGSPVVLVHGSASDYRTWQEQLERLGARHRVVAYSRRYHWPNAPIPQGADYAMEEHVRDLDAMLRFLAEGPVHLVGHSYGAFVALLLAIRAPRLVCSLVLAEPPVTTLFVSAKPRPSEILRLLLTRPRTAASIVRFGATGIGPATAAVRRGDLPGAMRVFGTAVLGRDYYRRLTAGRLEQVQANAIAAEFLGSGLAAIGDDDVRSVRVPVLLVGGRESPALFARLLDRLEELLPRAERVVIDAASHIVHEDNAPAYAHAVQSFLAAHEAV